MKLTKENLPIGTKVVPHSKTAGELGLENSICLGAKKEFLYYSGHNDELNCAILSDNEFDTIRGDYFNYSDFTLYEKQKLSDFNPKDGDLCLFSNDELDIKSNIGLLSDFHKMSKTGLFVAGNQRSYKFCRKVKNIEFYG